MIIRTITGTLQSKFNNDLFQPFEFDFENKKVGVRKVNPVNGNIRANSILKWYPMENLTIKKIKINGIECKTWEEVQNF